MGLRSKLLFRRLNRACLDRARLADWQGNCRPLARRLGSGHEAFAAGGQPDDLQAQAQRLVGYLSDMFLVGDRPVFLRDQSRPHRKNRQGRVVYELHGACHANGPIEVFLRTAVHGRPVAHFTLLETLCHEWVHHYDFQAFGDSVHCGGFYQRLRSVYLPLRQALGPRR